MTVIPISKLPRYDRTEFNTDENGKMTMKLIEKSDEPGWFINGRKLTDDELKETQLKMNMSNRECNRFDTIKNNLRTKNPNVTFGEVYKIFCGTR
jgi:membrane carboxypeptidase/penicillin-binding protein PbpC